MNHQFQLKTFARKNSNGNELYKAIFVFWNEFCFIYLQFCYDINKFDASIELNLIASIQKQRAFYFALFASFNWLWSLCENSSESNWIFSRKFTKLTKSVHLNVIGISKYDSWSFECGINNHQWAIKQTKNRKLKCELCWDQRTNIDAKKAMEFSSKTYQNVETSRWK